MEATWLSVRFQANYSLLHVETYKTLHLSLILMDLLLEPTILEPTILEPTILKPTILEPTILEPTILEPTILEPTILEPTILEPTINEQPGEFSCSRPQTNTTWVMVGKPPHIVGEIRK